MSGRILRYEVKIDSAARLYVAQGSQQRYFLKDPLKYSYKIQCFKYVRIPVHFMYSKGVSYKVLKKDFLKGILFR